MLEFGGEVAFEIVLDDEDAEKIGVAAGAQDVPGESGEAEGGDDGGMKEAESVSPALGEERPEKNGAAGEDNGGGAFGEDGEAEEESEEDEGEPGSLRKDRRVFVARETEDDGGAHHGDGEHGGERHVRGSGVRKTDHAHGGGKQEQQPASSLRAVETERQPGERERGEERADGAGQPRSGFANAEQLEAQRGAPIEERRLLEPGFAIEARRDPVAGFGHIARDPGVARLVWPNKTDGAEMAEVADVKCGNDEDGPTDLRRGAGARVFGEGNGWFAHGKWSLTSNHYLPPMDLLHTVARRLDRAAPEKR